MKRWQIVLSVLAAILLIIAGYAFVQLRTLDVEQLSEDLYVLRGLGGNVAVYKTDEGTLIVDTMTFPMQGTNIRKKAKELTGMDAIMLINTHYHMDHTHGNPGFEAGTRVLSTERTLSHMTTIDKDFWEGDKAALLPNETFTDRQTLQIGDKTIELVHPGPGHTDGDLVVLFTDEGVVHMGDLFFHSHYPNIDLEAGGTVQKWPQTLDQVQLLDFERVIPGHGATSGRAGLQQFQSFIQQLGDIGRDAAESNMTLDEVLETDRLTEDAGYEEIKFFGLPLGLDRPFVLKRAWEEATGEIQSE